MKKFFKKNALRVLVLTMLLSVFTVTAFAVSGTVHYLFENGGWGWSMSGDSDTGGEQIWTVPHTVYSNGGESWPAVQVKSKGSISVGAETTYYKVVLSAGGRTSSDINADGSYHYRGFSGWFYVGRTYQAFHQRVDTWLDTKISNGITNILFTY